MASHRSNSWMTDRNLALRRLRYAPPVGFISLPDSWGRWALIQYDERGRALVTFGSGHVVRIGGPQAPQEIMIAFAVECFDRGVAIEPTTWWAYKMSTGWVFRRRQQARRKGERALVGAAFMLPYA